MRLENVLASQKCGVLSFHHVVNGQVHIEKDAGVPLFSLERVYRSQDLATCNPPRTTKRSPALTFPTPQTIMKHIL